MTDVVDRYPFSTKDGQPIPLEIIRPRAACRVGFSNAVANGIDLLATTEIVIFHATVDCWLYFSALGTDAIVPEDDLAADYAFLPANTFVTIAPPIGKTVVSVIGDMDSGSLRIQVIEKWAGLSSHTQSQRR